MGSHDLTQGNCASVNNHPHGFFETNGSSREQNVQLIGGATSIGRIWATGVTKGRRRVTRVTRLGPMRGFLPADRKLKQERTLVYLGDGPPVFVIWSFNSSGHRSYFVKLLISKLMASRVPAMLVNLDNSEGLATVLDFVGANAVSPSQVERKSLSLTATGRHVRKRIGRGKKVIHVCLDGDRTFFLLPFMGVWSGRVLLVRSPSIAPRAYAFRSQIKRWVIRAFEILGFAFLHLSHPGAVLIQKVRVVRDPSPFLLQNKTRTNHVRTRDANGSEQTSARVVGIFGSIDPRKQPELVLEACARLDGSALKVAGKWESDTYLKNFLRRAESLGVKVDIHDSFLSDDEFHEIMSSVDVVAVMNQNYGSSGIALGAYDLGIPLVMSGSESMKQMAGHLDAIWAEGSPQSLANAFAEAFRSSGNIEDTGKNLREGLPGLDEFCGHFLN